jgi:hypothetical protein
MKLPRHFNEPTLRLFLLRTATPIIGLTLLLAIATTGLFYGPRSRRTALPFPVNKAWLP